MDKTINQLIMKMVRMGWTVKRRRHAKLYHPSGRAFVTFSMTPSDHRCLMNIQRDIKRLQARLDAALENMAGEL